MDIRGMEVKILLILDRLDNIEKTLSYIENELENVSGEVKRIKADLAWEKREMMNVNASRKENL